MLLLIGDNWAEDHHDIEIEDETGRRLAKARLPEGLEGITRFHALVAEHAPAAAPASAPRPRPVRQAAPYRSPAAS